MWWRSSRRTAQETKEGKVNLGAAVRFAGSEYDLKAAAARCRSIIVRGDAYPARCHILADSFHNPKETHHAAKVALTLFSICSIFWSNTNFVLRLGNPHTRCSGNRENLAMVMLGIDYRRRIFLGVLAFLCFAPRILWAQVPNVAKANYADALAFCAGSVTRPLALRDDKKVLCLDGLLFHEVEVAPALDIKPDGHFVVRGLGGDAVAMIKLAEILEARRATVVVRDYCFAACASYLLIASAEAIVPKNALVAWTNLKRGSNDCFKFLETNDRGAPRFVAGDCASPLHPPYGDPLYGRKLKFYARRARIEEPPESVAVRRVLKRRFDETGKYPSEMFWTWNPRYYASALKTKVVYEAYPQSQDEVDALRAQLQLQYPVIYDP